MNPNFKADLHIHSTYSDGSCTPLQILKKAKEIGLSALSITDHDTIDAYTDDFFMQAKEHDLLILCGIEISCRYLKQDIHILGYGFDLNSSSFRVFLKKIQNFRKHRNELILKKFHEKGIDLTVEELGSMETIGRPHFAKALVERNIVSTFQEAFHKYLHDGGPCWVSTSKMDPLLAIEALHQAGGKAVLAHPFFIKDQVLFQRLLQMPFDGLETYYGKIGFEQDKKMVRIAKEKKWILTGGSDFHGDVKPHILLGCSWIGYESFQRLQS